jgi:hypothetical protein
MIGVVVPITPDGLLGDTSKGTELTTAKHTLISKLNQSSISRQMITRQIEKEIPQKFLPVQRDSYFYKILMIIEVLHNSERRWTCLLPHVGLLKSNPNFIYRKRTSSPTLSEVHINA